MENVARNRFAYLHLFLNSNLKKISSGFTTPIYSIMQGVSRLVDITAGGDFLGLCDQKISYKHVSDFRRLRSYGHFLNSRTRPRVNRV